VETNRWHGATLLLLVAALLFMQTVPESRWVGGYHWLNERVFAAQDDRLALQEWRDHLAATAMASTHQFPR